MEFYKYHGTGNDFILIDNRDGEFDARDEKKIRLLCHRRFGVGADGILLLENSKTAQFKMIYINSDGSMGSMCGNGGRCVVDFAHNVLKIVKNPKKVKFLAVDGEHEAEILKDGLIKLKMQDVKGIGERNGLTFLHSGTAPHVIKYVDDVKNFPVAAEGKKIRYEDKEGTNVNFVEYKDGMLNMRTYERGIEDETWACGTGATCAAIASHHFGKLKGNIAHIKMPGGDLTVEFDPPVGGQDNAYKNIYLTGPATLVFKGEI